MPSQIIIPVGWELTPLGKIAEVLPSNVDKHVKDGEKTVFLCNYMDVYYKNKIISSEGLANGTVKASEYEKFKLRKGDVLITKDSETPEDIARSCVVTKDFDDIVCGYHVAMLKGKKTKINGFFLKRVFDVPIVQHYFFSLSNGVTRFGITKPSIESAEILLPPLPEQEKIVEVLEAWDSYLEKLTNAIKCKRALKKSFMCQLLEGKIRIPEFSKKWETKPLSFYLDLKLRPVSKPGIKFKALGIRSHCKGTFQKLDFDPSKIAMDTLYEAKENDLIVNITFAWEGAIAIVRKEDEGGLVSHRFPTYTFKKQISNADFFKQFIQSKRFRHLLKLISPGGAGRNRVLSKKDFLKLKIQIPDYEEQTAIANILTTADRDIEALEKKKLLVEQQKKFLLNNLITGRIRLPEFAETPKN